MPKYILRIVALLLIPMMLADPALAARDADSAIRAQSLFSSEAFGLQYVTARRLIFVFGHAAVIGALALQYGCVHPSVNPPPPPGIPITTDIQFQLNRLEAEAYERETLQNANMDHPVPPSEAQVKLGRAHGHHGIEKTPAQLAGEYYNKVYETLLDLFRSGLNLSWMDWESKWGHLKNLVPGDWIHKAWQQVRDEKRDSEKNQILHILPFMVASTLSLSLLGHLLTGHSASIPQIASALPTLPWHDWFYPLVIVLLGAVGMQHSPLADLPASIKFAMTSWSGLFAVTRDILTELTQHSDSHSEATKQEYVAILGMLQTSWTARDPKLSNFVAHEVWKYLSEDTLGWVIGFIREWAKYDSEGAGRFLIYQLVQMTETALWRPRFAELLLDISQPPPHNGQRPEHSPRWVTRSLVAARAAAKGTQQVHFTESLILQVAEQGRRHASYTKVLLQAHRNHGNSWASILWEKVDRSLHSRIRPTLLRRGA